MATLPVDIDDFTTVVADNYPASGDAVGPNLDDLLRLLGGSIALLRDKINGLFIASDYGVVGDGVADDTAAIEALSTAAGVGGVIVFPPGMNCKITSEVNFAVAGQKIMAHGVTFTEGATFSGSNLVRVLAANVTIDGLTVSGLGTGKSGIVSASTDLGGFTIRNCEVYGCSYGIIGNNNSNVLIERNYVHDCSLYGIWCQNITDTAALKSIKVIENTVDTTHLDPLTATQVCILVRGGATYFSEDVTVSNNRMVMMTNPTNSGALGCEIRYANGAKFTGNYAYDGAMLVSIALSTDVTVDDNRGIGQTFYSIEIASSTSVANTDIVVSNNTIDGKGILNRGIALQGTVESKGCTVTGNTIRGCVESGVFVSYVWAEFSISDNIIRADGATQAYGIYALGSTDSIAHGSITGNILVGDSIGKKAIYLYDCSQVTIGNNTIYGWTEDGIFLRSESGTVNFITCIGNVFNSATNNISLYGAGAFGDNIMVSASPNFRSSGAVGAMALNLALDQYIAWGTGTPEGVVPAGVGSLFLRSNGGAGTTLYVKQSGTGNTGWVGK